MASRKYYSIRTGKNLSGEKIDLSIFLKLFIDLYIEFDSKYYFQEAFGYQCVDNGFVPGKLGSQIEAQIFRVLKKENIWPITEKVKDYSEDDVFDVIEFLYDHVSKPVDGYYHEYSGCGWHYGVFDQNNGKDEFRKAINEVLIDYSEGYELSESGELLIAPESGLDQLINASMPSFDPDNVEIKVENAKNKFRRYKSSQDDRKDAIRDLIDVLEFLRPKIIKILTRKDENDLFELANRFGLRHHDLEQKIGYEKSIWYSWMFYYYLATIHACIRLIKNNEEKINKSTSSNLEH